MTRQELVTHQIDAALNILDDHTKDMKLQLAAEKFLLSLFEMQSDEDRMLNPPVKDQPKQ